MATGRKLFSVATERQLNGHASGMRASMCTDPLFPESGVSSFFFANKINKTRPFFLSSSDGSREHLTIQTAFAELLSMCGLMDFDVDVPLISIATNTAVSLSSADTLPP